MKPYEVKGLVEALGRVPHTEDADSALGADESTLGTIFPSMGVNP